MSYNRERLGKRNLHYNIRHRDYGDLSAMDVDFMEYKDGKPVGLFETKFGLIRNIDLNAESFDALCELAADRYPVFCTVYYPMCKDHQLLGVEREGVPLAHIQFVIIPVNEKARRLIPSRKRMSEKEYVQFLYDLRGEAVPTEIENKLYTQWLDCVTIPQVIYRPMGIRLAVG